MRKVVRLFLLVLLLSLFAHTNQAIAATVTWDSNGVTAGQKNAGGAWLDASKWWNGATNVNWTSGDDAIFGVSGAAGNVTLASPTTVNSLTLNSFTGTYTLGTAGQTITLNNGITKNSGGTATTIISPIVLGGAQTWLNNSTGLLTHNAATDNDGHLLIIDGTGHIFFPTTVSNVISGTGGLTKNGSGFLTLGAGQVPIHTYTGPTIINGGTVMQSNNNIPSGNISINGGILESYWATNFTRALGSGANQIQILGGTSGFGLNGSTGASVTINNNAATEVVWGSAFFNPSTFALQANTAQGTSSLTFSNKLDLNGADRTIQVLGGTTGAASANMNGVIRTSTGTAGLIKIGTGRLILSAANTYNGDTTISGGILQIGNNNGGNLGGGTYAGNISIASGSALRIWGSGAQILSGAISGAGEVTKAYGNTLTLSGNNTYTGTTSIIPQNSTGSILSVSSFNSVNGGTPLLASSSMGAPTTIANGTIQIGGAQAASNTLRYTGPGETTDRRLHLYFNTTARQSLDASGSGLVKFTSDVTITPGTGNASGGITLTGTGNGELAGVIPALPGTVQKTGTGTWTLSGTNAYTTATTISAGTLQIGAGGTTGSIDSTSGVTNNSVLSYNRSDDISVDYSISGTGSLTKQGLGTLTLSGNNTYSGNTTISTGTLALSYANNNNLATSSNIIVQSGTTLDTTALSSTDDLILSSGQTLKGNGVVIGNTTIASNSTLSPGTSPGTINHTGDVTYSGGGNYRWEINDATGIVGTNSDLQNITGTLNIAATSGNRFTIDIDSLTAGNSPGNVPNFDKYSSYTWTLASAAGGITGFDNDKFNINDAHFTNDNNGIGANGYFVVQVSGNNLELRYIGAIDDVSLSYSAGPNGTLTGSTSQTISYGGNGTTVTAVPDMGYIFVDWSDASPTNPRTDTAVTQHIAVTARFAVNQYTLTFDTDGGTLVAPITDDFGAAIIPPTPPTKAGYSFAGWSPTLPSNMPASDGTHTAQWTINSYTITLDPDGGSPAGSITADFDAPITDPIPPTKPGYVFGGWNPALPDRMHPYSDTHTAIWSVDQFVISFDGLNGIPFADPIIDDFGALITPPADPTREGYVFAGWDPEIPEFMPAANSYHHAQWTPNQYSLTFDLDGGTGVGQITAAFESTITPPTNPTKLGYTFAGWDPVYRLDMHAHDHIHTAQWTANRYTITFDTDGGNAISPITDDFGAVITSPEDPTKEGYTFAGWSPALPLTIPAGDQTYIALWTNNGQFSLTFNSDGGTLVDAIIDDFGATITPPADPTKEGYTFTGWSPALPSNMPAANQTHTAQWIPAGGGGNGRRVTVISTTPAINPFTASSFITTSENPSILEKLQSLHPEANLTEALYQNTCETNKGKPFYRKCLLSSDFDAFTLFKDSVLCEGFIVKQEYESAYRYQHTAPRKEVVGLAVKMKKIEGKNIPLVTPDKYKNLYTDIGIGEVSWIQPIVETALKYRIITKDRTTFEPDRDVTRAEAYAMIMQSVCMTPSKNSTHTWQQNIFTRAKREGLTSKTWDTYESERPILRQELFLIASKASDWAERTGGCDPKPEYCFVK